MQAVRIAKDEQVQKVAILRSKLLRLGHSETIVEEALVYWANHEARARK